MIFGQQIIFVVVSDRMFKEGLRGSAQKYKRCDLKTSTARMPGVELLNRVNMPKVGSEVKQFGDNGRIFFCQETEHASTPYGNIVSDKAGSSRQCLYSCGNTSATCTYMTGFLLLTH